MNDPDGMASMRACLGDTWLRLVATLEQQFAEGAKLEKAIRSNLRGMGYAR